MAYNTKPIVTDVDGNPISQYYNPDTDQYEPVEGNNGANKVILYKSDGTENNELSLIPILEKLEQLTGTVIDEETRKQNEIIRQDNEQNRIQLYNALLDELERIEQIQEQVPQHIVEQLNSLKEELGDLANLETADKSSIVNAINEVNNKSVDLTPVEERMDEIEDNLDAHKAEKATQTKDGHMSKEDKAKLDRIEEDANKTDYYYGVPILPTDEEDKFKIGHNIWFPNVTFSNYTNYKSWLEEVYTVLGYSWSGDTAQFRLIVETIKYSSRYMIQYVYVHSNIVATMGSHIFTLHRTYGFGTAKWQDWQVTRHVSLYGDGNPEGSVYGFYGSLYLDIENNRLYLKKGVKNNLALNTGWELIGGV